jgi:hypothetical protein
VKVPIKPDRCGSQIVSLDVSAFQVHKPPVRIAPRRRDQHAQVYIIEPRHFFEFALVRADYTGFGQHQNTHKDLTPETPIIHRASHAEQ